MIFTIEEMTLLCLIQKVTQLPGFPTFTILSKKQSEQAIASLIKKKILKEDRLLSEEGLRISEVLSLYVQATIFYKFGKASTFAKYREQEYIMVTFNNDCYQVDLVNQQEIQLILINKLRNWKSVKDGEYKKSMMLTTRFNEFIEEKKDVEAISYYTANLETKTEGKGVLFIDEGYFKIYDITKEEVSMYPRQLIQQGIENIFV